MKKQFLRTGAVITDQLPEAGSSVYIGTQVLIYLKESPLSEGDTT